MIKEAASLFDSVLVLEYTGLCRAQTIQYQAQEMYNIRVYPPEYILRS